MRHTRRHDYSPTLISGFNSRDLAEKRLSSRSALPLRKKLFSWRKDLMQLQEKDRLCSSRILASPGECKKSSRRKAELVRTAGRVPVPHCKQPRQAPNHSCTASADRADSASRRRCSLADRKYFALRSAPPSPAAAASAPVHSSLRQLLDRNSIRRQSR